MVCITFVFRGLESCIFKLAICIQNTVESALIAMSLRPSKENSCAIILRQQDFMILISIHFYDYSGTRPYDHPVMTTFLWPEQKPTFPS